MSLPPDFWTNPLESEGYNILMYSARVRHDPYDQYGWVQDERFALADAVYVYWGVTLPGYHPSPLGVSEGQVRESLAGAEILDILTAGDASYEDTQRVFMVLSRFRAWLGIAGEDY